MKKWIYIFTIFLILLVCLSGCYTNFNNNGNYTKEDLQGLSQIEVYTSNGDLINTITDNEMLYQFNNLNLTVASNSDDAQQATLRDIVDNYSVLYTVVVYKTPAAVLNDGTLEKIMEITVYNDSNIIKEQIEPEIIKSYSVPEEDTLNCKYPLYYLPFSALVYSFTAISLFFIKGKLI